MGTCDLDTPVTQLTAGQPNPCSNEYTYECDHNYTGDENVGFSSCESESDSGGLFVKLAEWATKHKITLSLSYLK